MSLLRNLRLYANRCPHCGHVMRLYTWEDSPVKVPLLTHVRICPQRHYMDAEHLSTRKVQVWDEGGKVLSVLAEVSELPDLSRRYAPIHTNLNVPLRKPPVVPKPPAPAAAAAAVPAPAAAAAAHAPASPAPAAAATAPAPAASAE